MSELHNDHNVYILGAGFSAERGLPMVKDFMFKMRDALDWLDHQKRKDEIEAIRKVLEFRGGAASAAYRVKIDLENIEELFSLASASTKSNDLSDSIRIAIAATLDYCGSENRITSIYRLDGRDEISILNSYRVPQAPNVPTHSPFTYEVPEYEYYLRSALGFQEMAERKTSFISFNYDTVVEEAFFKLGVKFSYGFGRGDIDYEAEQLGLDDAGILLLKLHGSINWGRRRAATSGAGKLTICDSYEKARSLGATPDLIPPTWRKVFDGYLEDVWQNALDAIRTATRIIVIGFSVPQTDNHFKYLLAAGLQSNISLRDVIFVNPDNEKIMPQRIDALFTNPLYSRVTHKNIGVREFLGQYQGQELCNRPLPYGYSVARY
jgi:hypothetical protein